MTIRAYVPICVSLEDSQPSAHRGKIETIASRRPRRGARGIERGCTNRCLARQPLCLYVFPHVSHLSSVPLSRRPSLRRSGDPSLARRDRAFALGLPLLVFCGPDEDDEGSSVRTLLRPCDGRCPCRDISSDMISDGAMAGGDEEAPFTTDRPARAVMAELLPSAPGRPDGGMVKGMSPASFTAAATAANWFAVVEDDMLFLRVTRCVWLMAPKDEVCECMRECHGRIGTEPPPEKLGGRWWLTGRESCCRFTVSTHRIG